MELKDQVASLETSKILKELGVKQESLFWHQGLPHEIESCKGAIITFEKTLAHREIVSVSAFTASELAEMLPSVIIVEGEKYYFELFKTPILSYRCHYHRKDERTGTIYFGNPSLVETLAICIIHLLEEMILTPRP